MVTPNDAVIQKTWNPGDDINMAIGQGYLLVTPLQEAIAYSAIANGGKIVRPHVVDAILDPANDNAVVRRANTQPVRNLHLSPEFLTEVEIGLHGATHDSDGTSGAVFGIVQRHALRRLGQDRHGPDQVHARRTRRRLVVGLGLGRHQEDRGGGDDPKRRPRRRRGCARRAAGVPEVLPPEGHRREPALDLGSGAVMQNYFRHLDYVMLATTASICAFGLWILRNATRNDPGSLYSHQVVYMVVGWVALLIIAAIPPRVLRRLAWPLYGFVLLTTGIVLVLGTTVQGGTRWISLGPFQFQPSEFAKLFLIVGLASVLAARRGLVSPTRLTWIAIGFIGLPALLVFLEPDFGTTLVLVTVTMGMLFVFGAPWRHFLYIVVALGLSIALVFSILPGVGVQVLQKYQRDRWTAFLNPNQNQQDSYHLRQSLIAISHGGAAGTGAAGATQTKLGYLPEHSTDFVFAVVGEERGFLGSVWLIAPLCAAAVAGAEGDHVVEIDVRQPGRGRYRECVDVPDLHQHRHDHRTGTDHRYPAAVHELRRLPHPGRPDVDRRAADDPRARLDP